MHAGTLPLCCPNSWNLVAFWRLPLARQRIDAGRFLKEGREGDMVIIWMSMHYLVAILMVVSRKLGRGVCWVWGAEINEWGRKAGDVRTSSCIAHVTVTVLTLIEGRVYRKVVLATETCLGFTLAVHRHVFHAASAQALLSAPGRHLVPCRHVGSQIKRRAVPKTLFTDCGFVRGQKHCRSRLVGVVARIVTVVASWFSLAFWKTNNHDFKYCQYPDQAT